MKTMFWLMSLVALFVFAPATLAQTEKAEETQTEWKGSVEDEKLMSKMPDNGVIVSAKAWKELFEAWKFAKKLPEVDFEKNLVVIGTTRGSRLGGKPRIKEMDLEFTPFSTRDLRPGFRFLIIVASKEGIKTVNGKDLPKE